MIGNDPRSDSLSAAPDSGAAALWRLGSHTLSFAARPLVMGILNLTPDSFHSASRIPLESVIETATAMATAGADMLDLGAESTRPGAEKINPAQEQDRLLPAVERIHAAVALPITVDTTCAETGRLALEAGADGINDISAGRADHAMLGLAAKTSAGLVLMHMQGSPDTMQDDPQYDDVVTEISTFLAERVRAAQSAGVAPERILIDPGIGFGKTLDHNLRLLGSLTRLNTIAPVLLGASRKSFIGMLDGSKVEQRLGGSLAAVALAHTSGAAVVRVHDVAETRQLLDVLSAAEQS